MRRALKVFEGLVGLVLLAGLGLYAWGGRAVFDFPSMPSAYEAKEYCSCRFTSGRDAEFCDAFVHQDVVPTQGRTVDEEARSVTARALWIRNTARDLGDRRGCVLD